MRGEGGVAYTRISNHDLKPLLGIPHVRKHTNLQLYAMRDAALQTTQTTYFQEAMVVVVGMGAIGNSWSNTWQEHATRLTSQCEV